VHVFRWDLDKTYLDTDFSSLRGLVRSATEPAHAKRAVPGAAALVRALGARSEVRIAILSGSPIQLRDVLEEKLRLDGVRFDSLTLKDSLGNLRRGRIRALKGQLGYKLSALLRARRDVEAAATETLFGDDAEADALVYSVYADAVAGRVTPAEVSRIMEASGAYPDQIDWALESLADTPQATAVDRIFIRLDRGVPTSRFDALGPRVVPVHSWWQGALVLFEQGHLDAPALQSVLETVMWGESLDSWSVGALTQDLVRRGHLRPEIIQRLPEQIVQACQQAVARMGPVEPPEPATEPIDYAALLAQGAGHGWTGGGQVE
jgi:hypothetical protein